MKYSRVLTIAGSDSGGGAGIQADIKSIMACGCYASTAITAITVQNTLGVEAVHPVPLEIIEGQIDAVLSDIGTDAIKVGMLHSAEVVEIVCRAIDRYRPKYLVVDPVMVSTSGHRLIEESAVERLRQELLPRATIITPNIPEAELLLGEKIEGGAMLEDAARKLSKIGCEGVLLKAGHLEDDLLTDIFLDADNTIHRLSAPRVDSRNTHGTGCTLSSAVAAHLALGFSPVEAVTRAKEYLIGALTDGAQYEIGGGHGPVNHAYKIVR
ncbi:MAG: bifunctional hydroxymethylpyrimidine kinase/phosphomethylpyrimidine kinase [Rikenellaceae bacterium]